MSAYLTDPSNIGIIANIKKARLNEMTLQDVAYQATFLAQENINSVENRYPNHGPCGGFYSSAEGYIQDCVDEATFRFIATKEGSSEIVPIESFELYDIIGSYQYQSCEHEGWYTSLAMRYTESLKVAVSRAMAEELRSLANKGAA